MTRVYVDATLVGDDAAALKHLGEDEGFEVIVAAGATKLAGGAGELGGESAGEPGGESAWPARHGEDTAPGTPGTAPAWLLTGTPVPWSGHRPDLWTILVGPPPDGHGPDRRCDFEARDLRAAVLEVLAREVMPGLSSERSGRRPSRP